MIRKNVLLFFLITILLIIIIPVCFAENPEVYKENGVLHAGKGWSTEYNGLKVCYFAGTPEEIGRQHGQLVIQAGGEELINLFNNMQDNMKGDNFFVRIFKSCYAKFKFIPAFKRFIPDEYLQEMKGISLAVSDEKDDSIDEFIMANAAQDLELVFGCSSYAAWDEMTDNGDMIVGRNLDNLSYSKYAKYQYLAFYNPVKGIPFVTLNYPSYVGVMHGMNKKGIVVAMNYSKAANSEITIDGLPFMIMLRRVLQNANNLEEAVSIIEKTPRTVGLNILIASSSEQKAVVLETTASRYFERTAEDFIFATNRFQSSYMKKYQAEGWFSSELRDSRFQELQQELGGKIDYIRGINILRDKFRPESKAGEGYLSGIENNGTIASILFAPSSLKLWVSNRGDVLSPEGKYIGFNVRDIWESGQPTAPFSIISQEKGSIYNEDWLKVRKAEIYYKSGNKEKVVKLLQPFLQKHPEAEYPLLMLGITYIKKNNINKGIKLLEKLIKKQQLAEPYNLVKAYFWLGVTYDIFKNDRESARTYYKQAIQQDVPDMNGSNYLIKICKKGLKSPVTVDEDGRFITEGG